MWRLGETAVTVTLHQCFRYSDRYPYGFGNGNENGNCNINIGVTLR